MPAKNIGGYDPANGLTISLSPSGQTGVSTREDSDTLGRRNKGALPAQYSIAASDTPQTHDPLAEALQRLDAAYTDAVNMAIASYVERGLITEDEARRIFEQRQAVQS